MLLVIGSEQEHHAKHIYELACSQGASVCYLDSRQLPEALLLSWYPDALKRTGHLIINQQIIPLNTITSVYWRWYYGINVFGKQLIDENMVYDQATIIEREVTCAIESLFDVMAEDTDCLWVNSLKAIELHRKKGYQLNVMARHGIRIPRTLVTNNKDDVVSFYEANQQSVIYKPVRGGASTQRLQPEELISGKLDILKFCPVQFQELIEGVDIRVYGIGNQLFSAEIQAKTIDFRDDSEAKIIPVELPELIAQQCLKVMKLFDLRFTGIDIRKTSAGEYVFIEANPAPMFLHFERQTGYPISETLMALLLQQT